MKKKALVFVWVLALVAFVSSASAIDRAPKKSGSEKKKESTESKEKIKEATKADLKSRATSLSEKVIRSGEGKQQSVPLKSQESKKWPKGKGSRERYDYFMDKNNNGVDDRLEKDVKRKSVPQQEITRKKTPVPAEKTPAKISPVDKTPEKVKGTEVKEQKKQSKPKEVKKKDQNKRR